MKKKLASIIVCMSLLMCFVITAFAVDTPNVVARLTTSLSVAHSANTAGTHKWFSGTNSSSSKHKVYFEAQRSTGDKWVTDTKLLIDKGAPLEDTLTGFTGSTVLWRLELNPYGAATKNCTATGYMWYLM